MPLLFEMPEKSVEESSSDPMIPIRKAASMLGVSTGRMRVWDREGRLVAERTFGGHRRYRLSDILQLQRQRSR
jgi:DNA-binding transcriptional MerR regulator